MIKKPLIDQAFLKAIAEGLLDVREKRALPLADARRFFGLKKSTLVASRFAVVFL